MRIMILSGASHSLVNFRGDMIRELIGRGHDVIAVGPEREPADDLSEMGACFIQVPMNRTGTNPLADVNYLLRLVKIMREKRVDKVLSYTIKPVVYGSVAGFVAGVPNRYAMITGLGFAFTDGNGARALTRVIAKMLYRMALSLCQRAIFQNPDDLDLFVQMGLLPRTKSVIVNGSGVNLCRYSERPLPKEQSFLMMGRLLRDKGVIEYAEAARIVQKKYPRARFRLLGAFDTNPSALSMNDLRPYIDDGSIEYCGRHDDVRPFLSESRIYVLPSYREGTPRSVLEAMATGRPIITTDVPGCRETVIDGVNGFLVPARDARALANKMIWMLEHEPEAEIMAGASLSLVREKYDVNIVNNMILRAMML